MPHSEKQYMLRGFSAEIDLRPLLFVEPLPPAMVCSGCGLVPKRIAFLPCGHLLCGPCRGCLEDVCPLDGDSCREQHVVWRDLSVETLMSRQVACWNAANGCNFIADIPAMTSHFHGDCHFHAIGCSRCSAHVLSTELVQHLNSRCRSLGLPECANAGAGDRSHTTLSDNIENIALEVKATLMQISTVSALTEAKLKQISATNESIETSVRGATIRGDAFEAGVRELAGKQERAFDVVINMLEEALSAVRRIDDATRESVGRASRLGETLDTFAATQKTTMRDQCGSRSNKPQEADQIRAGLRTKHEETLRHRRTSPEQVPAEGVSRNAQSVVAMTCSNLNNASRSTDPVIFIMLDVLFRFIGNTILHAASLALMMVTGMFTFMFGWMSVGPSLPFFLPTSYVPVFHLIGMGCAFPWLPAVARVSWRGCLGIARVLRE
ncbi:uncharacterized protein LOC144141851 [Haemaphysalis longicornis]